MSAYNCMNTYEKYRVENWMLSVNIAPATCIPDSAVVRASNTYSKGDLYTGIFGLTATPGFRTTAGFAAGGIIGAHMASKTTYNVTFMDTDRRISEGVDHSILYPTQQESLYREFSTLEDDYGFYKKAR